MVWRLNFVRWFQYCILLNSLKSKLYHAFVRLEDWWELNTVISSSVWSAHSWITLVFNWNRKVCNSDNNDSGDDDSTIMTRTMMKKVSTKVWFAKCESKLVMNHKHSLHDEVSVRKHSCCNDLHFERVTAWGQWHLNAVNFLLLNLLLCTYTQTSWNFYNWNTQYLCSCNVWLSVAILNIRWAVHQLHIQHWLIRLISAVNVNIDRLSNHIRT